MTPAAGGRAVRAFAWTAVLLAGCATVGPPRAEEAGERPAARAGVSGRPAAEPEIRSRSRDASRVSQSLLAAPEPEPEAPSAAAKLLSRHPTPLRAAANNRWSPEGWQVAGRLLVQDLARPYVREGLSAWTRLWRRSPAVAGGIAAGAAALGAAAWLGLAGDGAAVGGSNTFRVGPAMVSIGGAVDPSTGQWHGALRLDLRSLLGVALPRSGAGAEPPQVGEMGSSPDRRGASASGALP